MREAIPAEGTKYKWFNEVGCSILCFCRHSKVLYTFSMNIQHLTNEEKLNEIFRMTEDNNRILHSLRRQQYYANMFRILYWIIIIASVGGAYFFIKPLIETFSGKTSGFTEIFDQMNSFRSQLPEAKAFKEIFQGASSSQN